MLLWWIKKGRFGTYKIKFTFDIPLKMFNIDSHTMYPLMMASKLSLSKRKKNKTDNKCFHSQIQQLHDVDSKQYQSRESLRRKKSKKKKEKSELKWWVCRIDSREEIRWTMVLRGWRLNYFSLLSQLSSVRIIFTQDWNETLMSSE